MKKVIIGIFAHPDDEAFGPSGTLLQEVQRGNDVHLITLTLGEAGTNPDNVPDLAAVREQEWRTAGALIGAKSLHFLGYNDGQLNNLAMLEIQQTLITSIQDLIADEPSDIEIELLSMDTNGISGHIDHIVASRTACYVFYQLKELDARVTRLRLACVPKTYLPTYNTNWLYMEAGREESEINEVIDATQYHEQIIAIMRAHHSQREDGEHHIATRGSSIGINHFLVKT